MKRTLLFIAILFTSNIISAQEFKHALGFRAGYSSGFEFRMFTDEINSYKFLLSTRDRGMQMHVIKEWNRYDLFTFTDQLVFIYGVGVHVGYERWDEKYYNGYASYYKTRTALIAGLDGLAGLEYQFYEVPISLGIEVKPYFDFLGREFFELQLFDFAFTAKYRF